MSGDSRFSELEKKKDLRVKLSALGGEQEERLARRRAESLNLPYVNLVVFPIDPDVLERLPRTLAEEAQAVIFYRQGRDVRLGAVNPEIEGVKQAVEQARQAFNAEPQIHVMSHRSFTTALARYRRIKTEALTPAGEFRVEEKELAGFEKGVSDMRALGQHMAALKPTEILTMMVSGAVKTGASDIHLEPGEQMARLRYRIDGVLQTVTEVPRTVWQLILSRVKVLSSLKLNVRDVPQDGSFVLRLGEQTYDVRVSMLPGGEGENIVMRFLNRNTEAADVNALGMKPRDLKVMERELKRSDGLILVTGPTGSGKTTSLASFIKDVNSPELKIITLEDPIEYRLPGVSQTEVDDGAGYTFAAGLRSILRQDPDIIMVGEVRDAETAETAVHAALTGHLVLTTLHTNDAPGAVPRLIDMGVKAFVLAPAVNVIIAQRLVRVVCRECGEDFKPDEHLVERAAEALKGVSPEVWDPATLKKKDLKFVKAVGCPACHGTGYKGRVGIFEVMPVTGEVEELVLSGADANRLREAALKTGMTTIGQDGWLKVLEGITTVEELERVTNE